MSASKRSIRRLSLMAGGSLSALWLLAGVGAAGLAPTKAHAANECDPSWVCSGTYSSITYPSVNGYMLLTAEHDLNVTTGGVYIASQTGAYTGFYSGGPTIPGSGISITNTSGPGMDFENPNGTIDVGFYRDDPANAPLSITGTTAGVKLNGSGWFWTTPSQTSTLANGTITATNGAGVVANTTGGLLDIESASTITGTTAAITSTGIGTLWITNAPVGVINGRLDLEHTGGSGISNFGLWKSSGINLLGEGGVSLRNMTSGVIQTGVNGAPSGIVFSSGNDTLQNSGVIEGGAATLSLQFGAGNDTLQNSGVIENGTALLSLQFGAGDDTLTNSGMIQSGGGDTVFDFGGGADSFSDLGPNGTLAFGTGGGGASTLTFSGLENWTESGTILFGANADLTGSDGEANDRVIAPNLQTLNIGDGFFFMDVAFSGAGQANCLAAVDADCVDVRGATVTGLATQTGTGTIQVVVNNLGGPGSLKPIVLVDAAGGSGQPGLFAIDNRSGGYVQVGAGAIHTLLADYDMNYNASTQQYALTPHPGGPLLGLPLAAGMVTSVWDATTGHWLNRQADLRDNIGLRGEGAHPGFWIKGVGNNLERTIVDYTPLAGAVLPIEVSHLQKTRGFVGGLDLLDVETNDTAWVAGLTAGHVTSDITFKANPMKARLQGNSYGAYTSFTWGGAFIDAIVNANRLDFTYGGGALARASAKANSLGAQAEGGYRFGLNGGAGYLEPLMTVSYLTTDIGDLTMANGIGASFKKGKALRGALGLRLGGKKSLPAFDIALAVTGRVWDDFSGAKHEMTLSGGDTPMPLEDAATGTLGDVGATLNLFSKDGRITGFADYGFKFRQGYSDSTASLGVRFNF